MKILFQKFKNFPLKSLINNFNKFPPLANTQNKPGNIFFSLFSPRNSEENHVFEIRVAEMLPAMNITICFSHFVLSENNKNLFIHFHSSLPSLTHLSSALKHIDYDEWKCFWCKFFLFACFVNKSWKFLIFETSGKKFMKREFFKSLFWKLSQFFFEKLMKIPRIRTLIFWAHWRA